MYGSVADRLDGKDIQSGKKYIREGSWFENATLSVEEMIKFTYCWCVRLHSSRKEKNLVVQVKLFRSTSQKLAKENIIVGTLWKGSGFSVA